MRLDSTELAALTATEYAVALNADTRRQAAEEGWTFWTTLVEDADFWAKQNIYTGLDLAISNALGAYSDLYKETYGFRPRKDFTGYTLEEIETKLDDLFEQARLKRYWDDAEDAWASEKAQAKIELEDLALDGDAERYEAMAEALGY